jgi:exonuclease III
MFQSGWFKFSICTVHIYFGDDSGPKLARRREEISRVAEYFGHKAGRELRNERRALILLGDFNIVSPEHETMAALKDQKFEIPATLQELPSNQSKTKHYDQIAFRADKRVINFVDKPAEEGRPGNSGVFDVFKSVFRFEDESKYTKEKGDDRRTFKTWRSYQVSDHLPMWVRIDVNDADEYIDAID